MTDIRSGWKILTHDWRSPIQDGEPLCTGVLPVQLPPVTLDTGPSECAAGWNYTATLAGAIEIASILPGGRPARPVAVEAGPDAIERLGKRRASTLRLVRLATGAEIEDALRPLFPGAHAELMLTAQLDWLSALQRPLRDPKRVQDGLKIALTCRGLSWRLQQYPHARATWAAWAARAAWAAWAA